MGVWREIFHFPFLRVAAARLLFYFPLSAVGASAISLARLNLIIYGSGRVRVESKDKPIISPSVHIRSDPTIALKFLAQARSITWLGRIGFGLDPIFLYKFLSDQVSV